MNQAAGHSVPSGILFFLWNLNAPLRRSGGHKAEDAPDKENHMNMNVYLNWSCCSAFEPCCRFLASWNFYFRPGWRLDGFSPSSLVCSLCMDSAHRWDASSSSLNSPVFSPLPLQMCLSWKWIWFPNSPPKMRRLTSGRLFPSNTRTGLERSFCRVSFGSFVDSLFQLTGLCFLFCFFKAIWEIWSIQRVYLICFLHTLSPEEGSWTTRQMCETLQRHTDVKFNWNSSS